VAIQLPYTGGTTDETLPTPYTNGGGIINLTLKEDKANKGVANGYAPLDANSKVPTANLPDQAAVEVDGKITTHNSATTSVHGIANTAELIHSNAVSPNTDKAVTFNQSGGDGNSEIGAWGFGVSANYAEAYIEPTGLTVGGSASGGTSSEIRAWGFGVAGGAAANYANAYIEPTGLTVEEGSGKSIFIGSDNITFNDRGGSLVMSGVAGGYRGGSIVTSYNGGSIFTHGGWGLVGSNSSSGYYNSSYEPQYIGTELSYAGTIDMGGGIYPILMYFTNGVGPLGLTTQIAPNYTGWGILGEESVLAYLSNSQIGRNDIPIGDYWSQPEGVGSRIVRISLGAQTVGGYINTSNGGGAIDTRATGSIQLGFTGTRTTLKGSASGSNKTITLPNATGTIALTSHTHGNLTSDGKIGSTANLPLITTTSGVVTTGTFGTTSNSFCAGDDSRLSNSRTPTSHSHSISEVTSLQATLIAFAIALG
jgi:hypothetical protein